MIKEVIYVASPYSNFDPLLVETNFRMVTQYVADRVKNGEIMISPITYGHTLLQYSEMPGDWSFWTVFCLSLLDKCDCMRILMLPDWEKSVGIQEEIKYADSKKIKIEYVAC